MKIQSLLLHDYRLFQVSGIKTFNVDFISETQVITGANGSGKTSLLNEISLLPQPRSLYGPEGRKVLTLLYDGSIYVLETDYARKTAPHSFLKDGEELNPSGTTAIQEDLARIHLGYNKIHDPILQGRLNVTEMQLALRKSFFMTLSPFNLSFVLNAHKTVSRKRKDVSATLAHLQARDQVLKEARLPEKDLLALKAKKTSLQDTVSRAVEYVHRLEEILRSRPEEPFLPLSDLQATLKTLRSQIPSPKGIDPQDPETQLSRQEADLARMDERLERHKAEISRLLEDIALYDTNLKDMQRKRTSSLLDQEMASLAEEIKILEASPVQDPFPHPLHETLESAIEEIRRAAVSLVGTDSLLDSRSRSRKTRGLARRRPELSVIQDRLAQIQTERASLGIGVTSDDLPKENCAKSGCPLWRTFMETRNRIMERKAFLDRAHRRFQTRLDRLNRYVRATAKLLEKSASTLPPLRTIHETLKRYPVLQGPLSDSEVFHLLKTNPLKLPRDLQTRLDGSRDLAKARMLKEKMDQKVRETKALDGVRLDQEDAVRTLRDRAHARLDTERRAQADLVRDLTRATDLRDRLKSWTEISRSFSDLLPAIRNTIQKSSIPYERQILLKAKSLLLRIRDEAISDIGGIDQRLLEQDRLDARYENEVKGQFLLKEKDARDLSHLDRALSPFHGIPHAYLTAFLNAVLDVANLLISQVFTYPFELLPLDPDTPLDYRFPVLADGVKIDDIGSGSAAQQEMVNLAFTLALMNVLDLSDRPLVLDEVGRTFDIRHRQNLLPFFQDLQKKAFVSTLFLVSHNETVLSGLPADIVVLGDGRNIVRPEVYNEHVKMT